jgi:hypothetical protein
MNSAVTSARSKKSRASTGPTAAALVTVGEAAVLGLRHLDVEPGQRLLIHGAAGSAPGGSDADEPRTGQHVGLQTDEAESFYAGLGYVHQPVFMSAVVGEWLGNEANRGNQG